MKKSIRITLILSIFYLCLIHLRPIWQRHPGGSWTSLFYLGIVILFLVLALKGLIKLGLIIIKKENRTKQQYIPVLIITVALLEGIYNPFKIDLNKLYGKEIFHACYEGTQNQATFKLLEDNKFEIHWTGAFFYDEYFTGKYLQNGDTLFLDYNLNKPKRFGEKILMDNNEGYLITIRSDNDSLINVVPFYYGHCKGLN